MKKTIIESYPRSGHHFLVNGLLLPAVNDEINYCEVYKHCKTVPCLDKKTNLQKSHDFRMNDPIDRNYKYIIQYRHPYESIASYFLLETNSGRLEEGSESWNTFLIEKTEYWIEFMEKWAMLSAKDPEIHTINVQYYDLLYDTVPTLRKVLKYLEVEQYDEEIVLKSGPNRKSVAKNFIYYNQYDVAYVEEKCEKYIKSLDIRKATM